MTKRNHVSALGRILCALSLAAGCLTAVPGRQTKTAPARPAGPAVFQIERASDGVVRIEPMFVAVGATFEDLDVPSEGSDGAPTAGDYYRGGRRYGVIFGGSRSGVATVKASRPEGDCNRASAFVDLDATARLAANGLGLATDPGTPGRPEPSRRAPTPAERADIGLLIRATFAFRGAPAALAAKYETINLTATDLDGDGTAELVGTFKLKRTAARLDFLFAVAEAKGGRFALALSNYTSLKASDLPDPDALKSAGPGGYLAEVFVDQLDTDGDGTGELFTRALSFEGVNFRVYRKTRGRWLKAGEAYNYHCAY